MLRLDEVNELLRSNLVHWVHFVRLLVHEGLGVLAIEVKAWLVLGSCLKGVLLLGGGAVDLIVRLGCPHLNTKYID